MRPPEETLTRSSPLAERSGLSIPGHGPRYRRWDGGQDPRPRPRGGAPRDRIAGAPVGGAALRPPGAGAAAPELGLGGVQGPPGLVCDPPLLARTGADP